MQVASKARRFGTVVRSPSLRSLLNSNHGVKSSNIQATEESSRSSHIRRSSYSTNLCSSGTIQGNHMVLGLNNWKNTLQYPMCSIMMMPRALFSSSVSTVESSATEAVKEVYDNILKSIVEQRTAPPNALVWSLIEKCANHEDIKLLFQILQRLRVFRLSNLRIHDNFNCALCREITKACVRVGAIDFGMKALSKHNVYGLSPTIGSAHHLLMHAEQKNDSKLMVEIMSLLKKNDLPLQPGTADIVFRICYNTDNWELITKYSKKFIMAGVKLRETSFNKLMEFAAKIGDIDSLWKIEKLRSESMKQHTLVTGFSCAKGLLLEHKPENAAAIIQVLNQILSNTKRPGIMVELQNLVSNWPSEVIKRQKEDDRKALGAALQNDIPAMVSALLNMGVDVKVNVNMEDLTGKEGALC